MIRRWLAVHAVLWSLTAIADAVPVLQVTKGGNQANGFLDADGNWVWRVSIQPTAAGSSIDAEIGFTETSGSELVSATANVTNFPDENAGTPIFGWEELEDVGGGEMRPVGLQTNVETDQVFTALGSTTFANTSAREYVTIRTQGPSAPRPGTTGGRLTTTLEWSGVYGVGSDSGRITETIGGTPTVTDTFKGSASFTVKPGDSDLDGIVEIPDVKPLWRGGPQTRWQDGDFYDDNSIDVLDFHVYQSGQRNVEFATSEASIKLSAHYVQSYDSAFNPLGRVLATAPASASPSQYHQFAVSFEITGAAADEDFQMMLFDIELGPGLKPADFGGWVPENVTYDPPGPQSNVPVYSANMDGGNDTNDFKRIILDATLYNDGVGVHGLRPGIIGTGHFSDFWVQLDWSQLAGSSTSIGFSPVGLNPWGTIVDAALAGLPASTFSVGEPLIIANSAGMPGDYNNDNVVDALDYTVWRNNLGDTDEADIHHNGDGGGVDADDFTLWKQQYGASLTPGGGGFSSSVPEPATSAMLILALVGCVGFLLRRS